ncbi:hypothetical protein SLS57_000936 [Botryosphaeria dothidea]
MAFLPEVWTLYGIAVVVFALRFFVRIRTLGIGGLCGDDYFAVLSVFFLTIDGIVVDRALEFTKEQLNAMTDAEIDSIGIGSKFEFMGPFTHNWQVRPQPSLECTFHPQNVAVVSTLNIATDVAILTIPVPMLWTLHARLRKKIIMGCFLLGGVLVIVAAIIRVIVTLGSHPSTVTINLWGIRETVIAVIAVNAPLLRPLFTRAFWSMTSEPTELTSCGLNSSSNNSRSRPITAQELYTNQITGGGGKLPIVIERPSKEGDSRVNTPQFAPDDADNEQLLDTPDRSACGGVVVEVEVQVESEQRSDRVSQRDVEMGNATWAKGWR